MGKRGKKTKRKKRKGGGRRKRGEEGVTLEYFPAEEILKAGSRKRK